MASPPAWPGGLPSPTAAELEAAYRRLSQRVDGATASEEPLRAERIALRERYRGVHFPDLADALETLRSGADTADTSAE
jgi:hypothetical protein